MAMRPQLWTVNALAVELGRDRRSIAKLVSDLPPDGQERGVDAWRLKRVIDIMLRGSRERPAGNLDPEQQRARKEKELADAAALKNAVTRKELVSGAEVEKAWGNMIGIARERILAMPSKLGPVLAAMTSAAEVQRAIEDEVRTALDELAGTDIDDHDDDESRGDDPARA